MAIKKKTLNISRVAAELRRTTWLRSLWPATMPCATRLCRRRRYRSLCVAFAPSRRWAASRFSQQKTTATHWTTSLSVRNWRSRTSCAPLSINSSSSTTRRARASMQSRCASSSSTRTASISGFERGNRFRLQIASRVGERSALRALPCRCSFRPIRAGRWIFLILRVKTLKLRSFWPQNEVVSGRS